jgi:hypothetical protein
MYVIDQYLNLKSIDPKYWGKSGWIFLNSIALTFNPEYRAEYKKFIEQLPYILPCKTCGDSLKTKLDKLDEALESKQNFLLWLLDIRNSINIENSRPKVSLDADINEIFYNNNNSSIFWIIISIIILLLLILLLKNSNLNK